MNPIRQTHTSIRRACGRALLAAALAASGAARAATYYVDAKWPGPAFNGTASEPYQTLNAAIAAANAADGNIILVAEGIYKDTLDGGYEAFPAVGYTLTKSVTIRGGYAGWDGAAFDWTTRALRSSIVDLTNTTSRALYLNASKTVTLEGITFRNSRTTQSSGGAIYFNNHNTLTMTDCLFTNNVITTGSGGAVCSIPGGWTTAPRILNCDFVDNAAPNAGALYLQPYYANTTLLVSNCLFEANQATVDGGAVGLNNAFQIVSYDQMLFVDCVFRDNTAGDEGGAVCGLYSGHRHRMRRCTFVGNRAQQGAAYGINIDNAYWGSPVFFEQSLFYSNTCTTTGNKYTIHIDGDRENPAYIDIDHCTIVHNDGGIYNSRISAGQRELRVRNSIVAFNAGYGIFCDGAPVITYNNVYGNGINYGGTAAAGIGGISVDPLFMDAANNDYRLSRGSPCVDAGADLGLTPDLDQVPRPTRHGYDMGCYEEWQIPIIASRAAVATATNAEVRAEFTYESPDIATYAYLAFDTSDKGTNSLANWSQSVGVGEKTQGVIFGASFSGLAADTTYWYRCMASNSYDVFWGPAASFKTPAVGGATRLWTGLGGNALASNTNNWQEGLAPGVGDYVLLDSSPSNMTWDAGVEGLTDTVARWTQTENYSGTVTFNTLYGDSGFTKFTITGDAVVSKGKWAHVKNTTAETRRLRVTVGGDLAVGETATITADDLGYNYGYGPGYLSGCGGAYGGATARQSQESYDGVFNLKTYGSVTAPVNLGSGGNGAAAGYSGGAGAILLTVQGTTTLHAGGMITANGGYGGGGASGGSGGSVYLTTGWLTGSGTIRANGGGSTWDYPAGGSGGRIAVILTGAGADFDSWSGLTTAYSPLQGAASGNSATANYPAAAGTVYLRTSGGVDTLIIDNNNITTVAGRVPTLMPGGADAVNLNAFSNVVIRNKGVLGVRSDTTLDFAMFAPTTAGAANSAIVLHDDTGVAYPANWTIDGYTLYTTNIAPGKLTHLTIGTTGALSHPQNFRSEAFKLDLTLAGNLTVLGGGLITTDARGYRYQGPGYLSSVYGAAHGGTSTTDLNNGGSANVNRKTFGVITAPVTLGSSGGDVNLCGGGAILLNVGGTTTVTSPGMITANGETSNHAPSGGSILLRTGYLSGNGTIRANGGNTTWDKGTAGGGGRVGVILTGPGAGFESWTGSTLAYGGVATGGSKLHAAAGTVYLQTAAQPAGAGVVVVNNSTTATNATFTSLPAFTTATENLAQTTWVTTNNARIALATNVALAGLALNSSGALELAGKTLILGSFSITNRTIGAGSYRAADLGPLVTDSSGGTGLVIIKARGTVMLVR